MVDPMNVTDFNRDERDLQEFFIFAVCVAGKRADVTARAVARLLAMLDTGEGEFNPLTLVRMCHWRRLTRLIRLAGLGCFNQRRRTLKAAAELLRGRRDFLRTCSVGELEAIPGVGMKTARFFLMHSRPGQRLAAIDTHILKHLKARGFAVPAATPGKGRTKLYRRLEEQFLALADERGMAPADYDLMVWKSYAAATPEK